MPNDVVVDVQLMLSTVNGDEFCSARPKFWESPGRTHDKPGMSLGMPNPLPRLIGRHFRQDVHMFPSCCNTGGNSTKIFETIYDRSPNCHSVFDRENGGALFHDAASMFSKAGIRQRRWWILVVPFHMPSMVTSAKTAAITRQPGTVHRENDMKPSEVFTQ